jgi:hypothetical protein
MIITDKFIYVHQPKTGGSFVTNALIELYDLGEEFENDLPDLNPNMKGWEVNGKYGLFQIKGNKHSMCGEIKEEDLLNRKLLANTRNPLDLYVSQYEFGWWKRDEYSEYYNVVPGFSERFPNFPNLSFQEYLQLDYETFNCFFKDTFFGKEGFGMATVRFIKFYARNQKKLLPKIAAADWANYNLENDLYPIDFIKTHNLNNGLADFLVSLGFSKEDVQFIRDKEKVLPLGKGRTKEQKWQKYYTPELLETVLRKDKLLFDLFPEFIPKSL